jgi:hypothetical protein
MKQKKKKGKPVFFIVQLYFEESNWESLPRIAIELGLHLGQATL